MELAGIEGRMTRKKLKYKILKECLKAKMPFWDGNIKMDINLSKPKTYIMYHQFNIQQFYALPTQNLFVLCGS
jgi:hypothetical protein